MKERPVDKKPISEATRSAVLNAAWSVMAERKRLDVSQAEIAAAAGVSRQTVFLAFGNRAGLLMAMARHKDTQTDHVARLGEISRAASVTREDFRRYVEIWIDYLRVIYPVVILLDAAALTDADAAAAVDDRLKTALLAGLKRIFRHLTKSGDLAQGWKADRAAELAWSLIHPASFRQLVVGCGWSMDEFRRSRLAIMEATLLTRGPG